MKFSNRVTSTNQSPIREFAPLREKAEKEGKKVYPLNIGQPDIVTPKEYYENAFKNTHEVLGYTHSAGTKELLSAFSKYYHKHNMPYDEEDILVTFGGSEALLFSFLTVCDPGDEIIVFEPYYSNYNILAKEAGVKLIPVLTKAENNFALPSEKTIQKKITSKTKGIIVTNPNNPTGAVLSREEIDMLCKIAVDNDIFIISDEVYREFIYEGEFISFSTNDFAKENVIIVDSISKRFSACGARIGCIASKNKEFIAQALKLCQARLCTPYLEQKGACALMSVDDSFIDECVKEYKSRRDAILQELSKINGIKFFKPKGAFYFIVELSEIDDAHKFSKWILSEFDLDGETILLCPASEFYIEKELGKKQIRISYTTNSNDLISACKILSKGLEEYKLKNALNENKSKERKNNFNINSIPVYL